MPGSRPTTRAAAPPHRPTEVANWVQLKTLFLLPGDAGSGPVPAAGPEDTQAGRASRGVAERIPVSRLATGAARLRETARWLILMADRLESGQAQRHEFDPFIAELKAVQQDCFGRRPKAQPGQGAKARILAYLQQHVGEDVRGEDLAAMSGIQEWARRVRELRPPRRLRHRRDREQHLPAGTPGAGRCARRTPAPRQLVAADGRPMTPGTPTAMRMGQVFRDGRPKAHLPVDVGEHVNLYAATHLTGAPGSFRSSPASIRSRG